VSAAQRLLPIDAAVGEAQRLLDEWGRSLPAERAESGRKLLEVYQQRIRGGDARGLLWYVRRDEPSGMILWWEETPIGRRGTPYLARDARTGASLGAMLGAIESEAGPLLGVSDEGLFLPATEIESALLSRRYLRRTRRDMVYSVERPLPPIPALDAGIESRALAPEDSEALALLLQHAYADDPLERALFAVSLDPAEDARTAATQLLTGGVGRWIRPASFGVFSGSALVAATVVNDFRGPLITEVVVEPIFRGRGLARHLLARSLSGLRSEGQGAPRLVVSLANRRAVRLYESVGFAPQPQTDGSIWINSRVFGLSVDSVT
jgi:ribosomal protein S18 acetylase RimI-like enzyme